jgi:hypothetical protein
MSRMLEDLIGQVVVIDFRSTFVCIGKLVRLDDHYLELRNADVHDLRDTQTTRENYVVESHLTGIKRNRKRVFIPRAEVVALSALDDVVER